jgi:hypothetical protein
VVVTQPKEDSVYVCRFDYFVTVGWKGEGTIEDDTEIVEFGDLGDGEWG